MAETKRALGVGATCCGGEKGCELDCSRATKKEAKAEAVAETKEEETK